MSIYPGSLDSDATLYVSGDNVQTRLTVAQAITDTVAIVASTTGWAPNMIATIENEQELVVSVSGSNTLNVTRHFGSTVAAAHAAGKDVSNFVDSVYQSSAKAAIIAIETTLGPNLSNVSPGPYLVSTKYNLTPQSPGGSLAIGSNAFILNPIPPGIAIGSSLYISGTGTPEAASVTGWNSGTGQVVVTCAGTHSAGWTVQSASSGIQEAICSLPTNGGVVLVPPGNVPIYGTIQIGNGTSAAQSSTNGVTLSGAGVGITTTIGAKAGATVLQWFGINGGNIIQVNGPIVGMQINHLTFDGAPGWTPPSSPPASASGTALFSMHAYNFWYHDLFVMGVSGFAYDIQAHGAQTGFSAGSLGVAERLHTGGLQTTGSGVNVGGSTYSGGYENVARGSFKNLDLQVGSSGIGLQLQFVDSTSFEMVATLNASVGLNVINPSGSPNNFPTSITLKQCYFGGTTTVMVPVGWHPTEASDVYGGLLFMPWDGEQGPPPNANGVYGFTDNNQHFNFKMFPRPLTLANGANNDLAIGNAGFIRISGPTGAYNITGFAGGRDGRILVIAANTGGVLTISNQNSGSAVGNRIAVPGNADIALSNGTQAAIFVFAASDNCWYFVSGK